MEYYRPQQVKEALQLLKEGRGALKLLAGGTNVIPDLRAKVLKPKGLIDLSRLRHLSYIRESKTEIHLGALTTIDEIASSTLIKKYAPILSEAAEQLGNPLVRNRATIGGNLADASPAADTAPPLLALGAKVVTERAGGRSRSIPIDRWFVGPNLTVLKKDEMIKEIILPKEDRTIKTAYFKLGLRNSMAISVISVALWMEMEGSRCQQIRIALGAVAPTPLRAIQTERLLIGKALNGELIEASASRIAQEVQPITDIRGSAEYRREMASVLLKRLLRQIMFSPGG